ncbi:MAG: TraB/GumN family protein [Acidobacteriota bacterium]
MTEQDNVRILEVDGRTVHLVGTAHVSRESVEEVRRVIESVRPDTVVVELDAQRLEAMTDEERWRRLDIFQVIRQRKVPFLLASLALASYQERIGRRLGVRPGAELLAAVDAARAVGAELVLGDRDVQITLRRTWRAVSLFDKFRLLGALFGGFFDGEEISDETIEELKRGETLEDMLREFARAFPAVKEPLIDERDAWLASSIARAPGRTIVAVVGAAHVPGIVARLGQPVDRDALARVPPPPRWVGLVKWIVPAIVLGAFWIGWRRHAGEGLVEMTLAWLIPNSVLAALFSLLAGARLLSVATAFLASPITSLNPTIAAGMVVGLVEAWLRRPTVEDCQRIREDAQSLRGFYRNRFLRVLLVSALASLGSALGGWIGATWVVSLIGR